MSTCKDCFHFEVCNRKWVDDSGVIKMRDAKECLFFKDKFKFIDLRCKVGDTVWYYGFGCELTKAIVETVYFYSSDDCEPTIQYRTSYKPFYDVDIGHSVFLTKEEAKQAWREKNNVVCI